MNPVKRIQKEYMDIIKNPIEHIITEPNPENIFEWHYIIKGHIEPYKDGLYYGILTLPEMYPMKPPRIIMRTPNGRFKEDTRLCFSMSDYHVETWNPNWNIRTILIGFYSFMLEESTTQGSIECSYSVRKDYCNKSMEYNNSIELYKNIFENKMNFKETQTETETETDLEKCRYCFEGHNLISVCKCIGTNKWIHEKCLRKWQLYTILNQSTHPSYQVASDIICSVCNSEFNIKSKSRETLMEELTGSEIIEQIKLGYIFISDETFSKKNLEVMKTYNDVNLSENLLNWTYGVFLITNCDKNGIIAINTNRGLEQTSQENMYINIYNNYIKYNSLNGVIEDKSDIYIGGPCDTNNLSGIIVIDKDKYIQEDYINIKILKEDEKYILLFGEYKFIERLYLYLKSKIETKQNEDIDNKYIFIKCFIGYAGWSTTQLYGEFAKTHWGITNLEIDIIMKKNNYEFINKKNCLFVKSNIYSIQE